MRYGSVCSGIEAATAAWHPLGWRPSFFSEIEAFPRAVLAHHYPAVPLHGDFTTIKAGEYEPIDLLVGGTPCQSFSVAGLRGGLDDERGNLALEYLRLADRLRPRWLVWENVPGVLSSNGGRDFGAILGGMVELGYGFAYRVLDAQFFGLAQRRKRVFVVGYLGDWRRAAAVLFERHSLSGHPAPRREAGQRPAGATAARARRGFNGQEAYRDQLIATPLLDGAKGRTDKRGSRDGAALGSPGDPMFTLREGSGHAVAYSIMPQNSGKDYKARPVDVAQPVMAGGPVGGNQGGDYVVQPLAFGWQNSSSQGDSVSEDITPTLDKSKTPAVAFPINTQIATRHNALGEGTGLGIGSAEDPAFTLLRDHHHAVGIASAVRRLTPRECERLQGFPDDYTLIPWRKGMAPDGPRYKALGNSMAVPCMAWIGRRIAMVDGIAATETEAAA